MVMKQDKNPDPKDWSNIKLVRAVRAGLNDPASVEHANRCLDEIKRRFCRTRQPE